MSRRNHETPMDFEFQNGTGPIDSRSPFALLSQNAQRFPASSKKRTHSAFNSPSKPYASHQSSPLKPLSPNPAAFNALYNTPRKTNNNEYDDSSAGETPKSPERQDDSDATPDTTNLRRALSKIDAASAPTLPGAERSSPTKEKQERPGVPKRDSWMDRVKAKFHSPGRGEIPRSDRTENMERRIQKRRKREIDRQVSRKRRHSVSDSEREDSELAALSSPRKRSGQHGHNEGMIDSETKKEHWISSLFTFIGKHPTVPHILSWYAQLAFNVFILFAIAYVGYCFYAAIQGDIDKKAHEAMADIMVEMAACAKQYTDNRCEPDTRVPAMATVCDNWSKCMNRDPNKIGRAKVGGMVWAEIYTAFVEGISIKAMVFTFILVAGAFFAANFSFTLFRRTEQIPPQAFYQQPPPVPPTPSRGFSGGPYDGTPWFGREGYEPLPSGAGYGSIEGRGSPVKRLQY
ncbi:Di-sulfide bridge nucleocytoplasmic transport domain [Teratosphaeria destructans]|uniref:Di-sulfide bridge nucleocytoplasmic transport domain n=1 Tax=Teratosphaeria destructans TaxID=418781 RepID=A0A9W7W6T6_9PEZI|nr:Di-sulfide bridge nucleocytoplasmic transport domain [Teratosphaeria destructans]